MLFQVLGLCVHLIEINILLMLRSITTSEINIRNKKTKVKVRKWPENEAHELQVKVNLWYVLGRPLCTNCSVKKM